MDSKVRDLFRRETKDIISFENFNQIYYVFEQMVQYDVDVPELEGLGERLPYALNRIATEKLDRNDVITYFPIVWGKFEPYARKVLYIVNPEKYSSVIANKGNIVKVLGNLGIRVFVEKNSRTSGTDAVFTACKLRNSEAHNCEAWSFRKCYDKLANVMAAFLIVTNKVLPMLQSIMEGVPDKNRIRIPVLSNGDLLKVDIFDRRFFRNYFYRLGDYFSHYCRISGIEYDSNGWEISSKSKIKDREYQYRYIYHKRDQKVVRRDALLRIIDLGNNGSNEESEKEEKLDGYRLYYYNDEELIVKVEVYGKDYDTDEYKLSEFYEIEYKTDGSTTISYNIMRNQYYKKEPGSYNRTQYKDGPVAVPLLRIRQLFNPKGYLIKNNKTLYYYSGEDDLIKMENTASSTITEVKYIGNNILFIRKENQEEKGKMVEKRLVQKGRLKRIEVYTDKGRDREVLEVPELANTIVFDYYDEDN